MMNYIQPKAMSVAQFFPFFSIVRKIFFSEPKPLIEKELRNELLKLNDQDFISTMENLKKGNTVTIGKKQYTSHSSKIVLNEE